MANKKVTNETVTTKKAGSLDVGDRYRTVGATIWEEIVSLEKLGGGEVDPNTGEAKDIIFGNSKREGSVEEFRYSLFSNLVVEILS